ncbi:MAG TPA: alpha/beta hydrolase [Pseudonocardia sp.]|nr:alpha/beta hydrolase [Pseudonocardia sp.]
MILPRARVLLLRWAFRVLFGLARPVKRLLAGRPVDRDGQVLDLDLQLLGRVGDLLGGSGSALDQAALAEQRRQADIAAEAAADPDLDDVLTSDWQIPGPGCPLPARLYVPPSEPESCGLLVYFHGGGFVLGSLASTDPLCRLVAAQSGVRLLSVEYRLAPEHPYPAALEDALAAFRWARAEAPALGADPGLVAVGGDSAGGNLALVVAHQQTAAAPPAFVLALYPVTDADRSGGSRELFGQGFGLTADQLVELERLYLPDGIPDGDLRGAILRAEDLTGMPPVYLSTAGFDPLRDEGEELADRLREAGVPVVARRFAGLVHGYASFTAFSAAARDATLDAASALRTTLTLAESRTRPLRHTA